MWLRDANPMSAPRFIFNYLADEGDRREAIDAVRAIRNVIAQDAWTPYRGEEVMPGPQYQTDGEILEFLRENAGTNYHPCCSCRMGTDQATSVVDARARVHGFDNLRVVDASIMPEIVSGNLNAPVIMMAERVSDFILGTSLPPTPTDYHRPQVS